MVKMAGESLAVARPKELNALLGLMAASLFAV